MLAFRTLVFSYGVFVSAMLERMGDSFSSTSVDLATGLKLNRTPNHSLPLRSDGAASGAGSKRDGVWRAREANIWRKRAFAVDARVVGTVKSIAKGSVCVCGKCT